MPKDKGVVLGLISTKQTALEDAEDLRRRIDEASQYVDFERLALSPQCWLRIDGAGQSMTPETQRRSCNW